MIQLGNELYSHQQPAPVFKVNDPLPPPAGIVAQVGATEPPHEVEFWPTLQLAADVPFTLTLIDPKRLLDVAFEATVAVMVTQEGALVPDAGLNVIQEGAVAVQENSSW